MKRVSFFVCLAFLLTAGSEKATAQYYFYDNNYYDNPVMYELGGSIGIMNCLTDLGGKKGIGKKFIKDLNFGNTQLAGSIYANVTYKNKFAIRLEGTFGQVNAHDSVLKSIKTTVFGRYERNLSFRSKISEIALTAELHPLFLFIDWEGRDAEPPRISPYVLAGVGFFSFNPQAKRGNSWVDLQPLSTEGQGFKEYPDRKVYSLKQTCFPIGLGAKYELSPMINLRAEIVCRILSTDYLDDVSNTYFIDPNLYANYFTGTRLANALLLNDRHYELDPTYVHNNQVERGNPKNNDAYFTFNLKAGITLGRERIKR